MAQDVSKHRKIAHVTFGHVARILGKMEKIYFIMVPNFRSVKTPRTVQWVLHSPGGWAQVYYCFPDSLRIGLCRRRPPLLLAPARLLLTPARPPESRRSDTTTVFLFFAFLRFAPPTSVVNWTTRMCFRGGSAASWIPVGRDALCISRAFLLVSSGQYVQLFSFFLFLFPLSVCCCVFFSWSRFSPQTIRGWDLVMFHL